MAKRNAAAVRISEHSHDELAKPGRFIFTRRDDQHIQGMLYGCPCGCGAIHGANFTGLCPGATVTWKWDGDEEKPTLSPSLGLYPSHKNQSLGADGRYHWHGFLRSGIFEEC